MHVNGGCVSYVSSSLNLFANCISNVTIMRVCYRTPNTAGNLSFSHLIYFNQSLYCSGSKQLNSLIKNWYNYDFFNMTSGEFCSIITELYDRSTESTKSQHSNLRPLGAKYKLRLTRFWRVNKSFLSTRFTMFTSRQTKLDSARDRN